MSSKIIYKTIPIILAGGTGSRLWPLSRKSFPKQFLNLLNDDKYTMLQRTYKRIENLDDVERPIVVCNEEHRFIVAHQMKEINVEPLEIILEPEGRNTTSAITIAALKTIEIFKDTNIEPILLILSSDHQIKDIDNFHLAIRNSIDIALQDKLIIFGVTPTYPATGYGYIKSAKKLDHNEYSPSKVDLFLEKPDAETAKLFIKDKNYSWNSGIFVFKATAILKEVKSFSPEIVKNCEICLSKSVKDLDFLRLNKTLFLNCENISIDISVFEKTKKAFVIPLNCRWNDIGSWKSLWEYEKKNEEGNVFEGKVFLNNVKESYFNSSKNRLLVGLGVKDLIVVDTDDVTLISDKNHSQEVKNLVKEIKDKGMVEAENHKTGFRPWGSYLSIASDELWQVKLIEVKPGQSLSLQKHKYRAEHWIVVKGIAQVRIEDKKFILKENQSTFIPLGLKHQLSNPGEENLSIIEVQCGTYLGEDDIIRYEDKYGRK